jgi:maleate isomerase
MEAFKALGIRRYGLVTPYTKDVQDKIISNFATHDLSCGAEIHFDIRDNFAFGTVPSAKVAAAVREVAAQDVEAVVILCTNLAGAETAAAIETETGVPILDSVTLTVWGALKAAGVPVTHLAPWGPRLSQL